MAIKIVQTFAIPLAYASLSFEKFLCYSAIDWIQLMYDPGLKYQMKKIKR